MPDYFGNATGEVGCGSGGNPNGKGDFAFASPVWVERAESTSGDLRRSLRWGEKLPSGYVLAARQQTGGKGRLGSKWLTAGEGDLTFSFLWSAEADYSEVGTFPLACGLGVRDYLSGLGLAALCKWPNDIMVGNAKLCGILTEGEMPAEGKTVLVVGIGVNLRAYPGRNEELGRETVSVEELTGRRLRPEEELKTLLACLQRRLRQWGEFGFAAIATEMRRYLWGLGKLFSARTKHGPVVGTICGLGKNGELLLQNGEGEIVPVTSVNALEAL